VAALAGVPAPIITAARRYLTDLERRSAATQAARAQQELSLELPSEAEHGAVTALRQLDPDTLSPRAALEALYQLKKLCI
jgi:DNA mismatch repair protein MutS